MRLPVVSQISTKDGISNKNSRLTNMLKESRKTGDLAVVRPGLVLDAQASGVGNGLVVFNNTLVSVYGSTLGTPQQSEQGIYGDWTRVTGAITEDAYSFAFGDGVFMVSTPNEFCISENGITWDAVSHPRIGGALVLGNNGTSFCAVRPSRGTVYTSEDRGASWTLRYTFPGTRPFILSNSNAIHFDGTYYLISIQDDDGGGAVLTYRSTDGITWTLVSTPAITYPFDNFATGNGVTVAASFEGCYYSSDHGSTWAAVSGGSGECVSFGNNLFVLIENGGQAYSSIDGINFSVSAPSVFAYYYTSFDGLNFIVPRSTTGTYSISDDGSNWVDVSDGSGAAYAKRATSGNGITVAANEGSNEILCLNGIYTSITSLATVSSAKFDFAQSPL